MEKPKIIVTGANGQVAKEIRVLSAFYPIFDIIFLAKEDMPIHHFELVRNYFETLKPFACINCAAYTAVDKAETEKELAMLVNGQSTGVLASVCNLFNTKLIHISTDYVFDGKATIPYKELQATSPVNYYGVTKLKGEILCMENNPVAIIIRTSWVYSEFGNNFVKTMVRLMKEKESINVVNDQFGSPTYAGDLADTMLKICWNACTDDSTWKPGIYHYSNEGIISWYDFAFTIRDMTHSKCAVNPIPTAGYPTPAKRPAYSGLDKSKIINTFHLSIPAWQDSLQTCLKRLGV
jgi:dTDP-4-dehydrorhamnose reductase